MITFIDYITESTSKNLSRVNIRNDSVDLYQIIKKYYKPRGHSSWTERENIEFVEDILHDIPHGVIYLDEDKNGKLSLLHGYEKIHAVVEFMDNKFKIHTDGKEQTYDEMVNRLKNKLDAVEFRLHIVPSDTTPEMRARIKNRYNKI